MQDKKNKYRFLFAGGGTGGHLFPAIAVAEEIKELKPEAEILFIGTKNKIEGKVVPQLGYNFKSINVIGFSRKFNTNTLKFPFILLNAYVSSLRINMKFKPAVAIGSGGYVSGPAIYTAKQAGAKVILLEQNSFPGKTTKMLEKVADQIHVSYKDSVKYFKNQSKVFVTGNPVRSSLVITGKEEAKKSFGLNPDKKTLLVLGGSLGAASINKGISEILDELVKNDIQVIWQTGKLYYETYKELKKEGVYINAFIDNMNKAYSACDLLVSRAGATTIAEIINLEIPSILIPSPNVAENHQYYNAKSLEENGAALLIEDKNIKNILLSATLNTIHKNNVLHLFIEKLKFFQTKNSARIIAQNAIKLAEE